MGLAAWPAPEDEIGPGTVVDGKYRIDARLGRGGMGAVYRATHLWTDRVVALKVIRPTYAAQREFVQRFQREARACGRMQHPNIVNVTDFGFAESADRRFAYLVMEHLEGCSLAEVLRHEKDLPLPWVVDVLDQVCAAVEEAHRQGILHRDLKPDNVWLEPNRRGSHTVKVLDFGLAKLGASPSAAAGPPPPIDASFSGQAITLEMPVATAGGAPPVDDEDSETLAQSTARLPTSPPPEAPDDAATRMGSVVGTPAYMSPEQCRGDAVTAASDVYSIGVIAYQMLAGRPPFTGGPTELIRAHVTETPMPVGALRKDLAREAAALVMRALAKDPARRPRTAGEFGSILQATIESPRRVILRTLRIYLDNLVPFLRLSTAGHLPLLAATTILSSWVLLRVGAGHATGVPAPLGFVFLAFAAAGFVLLGGALVPMVMQAAAAPLRPMRVFTLLGLFRPRLVAYARVVAPYLGLALGLPIVATASIFGVAPFLKASGIPKAVGIAVAVAVFTAVMVLPVFVLARWLRARGGLKGLQFLGPTAVVEGLSGAAACRRSAELFEGAGDVMKPMLVAGALVSVGLGWTAGFVVASSPVAAAGAAPLAAVAVVIVTPFFGILSSLTYLRARQARGERLDAILEQFERQALPPAHWQLAARDRVRQHVQESR